MLRSILKTIHLVSLCIFLGSIATYIFLGELVPESNQMALALNRQWVLQSTTYLTIIAMCITGLTGVLLSGIPRARWIQIKLIGFVGILLNTFFFVYPAIQSSVELLGKDEQGFEAALMNEAIFGGVNILLILILIVIAIRKPKFSRQAN
ncbi:hypothetical protein [Photobacterium sp. TY1-4]|uniref:hypothetical protein n=1 Tax=Photobacterium sp. TY1-4 TaxID=2899122 RepID=UPI0021BF50B3|nr:hypothetical protein [Photobacterium sp. TY1-4]UXI03685.1 hypothetical protein NH461_25055 [Photobacterium sp. TY1-4]